MPKSGSCPTCGRPLARRDRVCVGCGYRRGGEPARTNVSAQRRRDPLSESARTVLIAAAGTAGELLFFALADASAGLARAFVVLTLAFACVIVAILAYIGWQDDGPLGVLWELRFPLGSELEGPVVSGRRLAVAWLLLLAMLLSGILLARHPGAMPAGWLSRTQTRRGP